VTAFEIARNSTAGTPPARLRAAQRSLHRLHLVPSAAADAGAEWRWEHDRWVAPAARGGEQLGQARRARRAGRARSGSSTSQYTASEPSASVPFGRFWAPGDADDVNERVGPALGERARRRERRLDWADPARGHVDGVAVGERCFKSGGGDDEDHGGTVSRSGLRTLSGRDRRRRSWLDCYDPPGRRPSRRCSWPAPHLLPPCRSLRRRARS
jgi:hypothetical protein